MPEPLSGAEARLFRRDFKVMRDLAAQIIEQCNHYDRISRTEDDSLRSLETRWLAAKLVAVAIPCARRWERSRP